ncbi:disks large-associated protein 5 [Aulostomus maculatus]
MESRFSHLRQRDTSVSMLRVKMSRRRSQSQKENRERAVNTRRQLDKLPELEISSLDASMAVAQISTIQEKKHNTANSAKNKAIEERLKQLERWKERKAFEKEKEKRERERKGVFKTGLYHPKDDNALVFLPPVSAASTTAKEMKVITAASHSSRVTRSMKQQQKTQNTNAAAKRAPPAMERSTRSRIAAVKPAPTLTKNKVCAVEPVVRALSTRSVNRPPLTAVPVVKPKDPSADVRTTRSRAVVHSVAPSSGRKRNCKGAATVSTVHPAQPKASIPEPEEGPCPPCSAPCSEEEEEEMVVDEAPADPVPALDPVEDQQGPPSLSSFAPKGFTFQAPVGLSSFKFEPLTPRSADAFLTPSYSFSLPPAPVFNTEPQAEPSGPSPPKSPRRSPPPPSPKDVIPTPGSPLESKHDVPYFRLQIAGETDRLTSLCAQWESKVEDESIPEEMRDRMRTAVGQARLLMKERFNQFSGLVDDCELCRGEKMTTCTDLQGFWDMVYYQVEDVNKKFDALKEAETRGWVEEHKPPTRQRKVVKKPAAAPAKPTGNKAAAKSRLAAVKAAMKARQQAAEAEKAAGRIEDEPSQSSEEPQQQASQTDTVVFDGGFFQVESPAKASGSVRRSGRLITNALPQASPLSNFLSPRRVTRHSLALAQTQGSPAQTLHTPAHLVLNQTPRQASNSQRGTPLPLQRGKDPINGSLCFSPVKEAPPSESTLPGEHPDTVLTEDSVAPGSTTPVHSLPSIPVVQVEDEPAEALDVGCSLSPRLSLSPCKSPVYQEAEPSSALRLSPNRAPHQPPFSSPTVISPAVLSPMEAQQSECHTPDSSVVEEIPGLDFERYLQPSQRCSLSPKETVAIETLSPMAEDMETESPRGEAEGPTQQEAVPPAVPLVLTSQSQQAQTAEASLLLFTPNQKDRIRQSVCPADLMVFTPPF